MFTPADLDIMILSHDRPEYVGQAIQSILNQSVQGFSIQVLDNGSGPETDKVLASFGDKIAIHKSLENKGGEWNYQRHRHTQTPVYRNLRRAGISDASGRASERME